MSTQRSIYIGGVDPKLLSVIVPAYNVQTIDHDLKNIQNSLEAISAPYEIICVVDGRKDKQDKTPELAKKLKSGKIKIYYYKENKGKGYAIRYGMARSRGGIISFIDSGGDLEPKGLSMALEHMKWYEADVVIGSKRHKASIVNYPLRRRLLSFIVQQAIKIIFGINVSDTQTGLKIFRREVVIKILPRLTVRRYAFDLEMLAVAHKLGFRRIYESPVVINYNFSGNIKLFGKNSIQEYVMDYLSIIYRTHVLHHYDDDHHDQWANDPDLVMRYE